MRILLIQDRPDLQALLQNAGFIVETARDGDAADVRLRLATFDIIVFDTESPNPRTIPRVQTWRQNSVAAHLLVLASKLPLQARIDLLNAGVDCYVMKPNHKSEVLARVRSLSRRTDHGKENVMRVFDLEIDMSCRKVRRGGRIITLTPREYALLRFLATYQGKVVTRSMILENVYEGREESNVINVYIRYLRNKIDKGFTVPLILTRYGQGYLLRGTMERDHGTSPISMAAV